MGNFINFKILQEIIIQSPADIIMAAEIILEYIFFRKCTKRINLSAQKRNVFGRNGVPGACHSCYIIENVAFRFLYSSEIRNNFFRCHNNFTQKQNTRANDLTDHSHHTDDSVNLRQVTAVCAKLFPDIRNRIQTYNINTLVGKIQHIVDHLIEHNRISVI